MVIWRWAKANGIDQGLPFAKIHDAINQKFYSGMGRPEWINDILSGRKTPFRQLATEAWKKQYNRRIVTQQAAALSQNYSRGPLVTTLQRLWEIPRRAAVFGHGVVFPVTHGGDLALRPQSWGVFMRGVLNTWTKSWSASATERFLDSLKRQPLFDTALRSGLDVGERSSAGNLVGKTGKGSVSERAWSMLTAMRYELWSHEMEKYLQPGMSQADTLDIGKNLAEWANHATGSARGPISNLGGVLFGPKLTQSKLNRMFVDPVTTIHTFANWEQATPGEKAVAQTRLKGLTQYLGSGVAFLAINQGVLWATGQKQSINFTDPNKSDFLAFKVGGLEFSLPGMHSEIRTLGKILATAFMSNKALRGEGKISHLASIFGQYVLGKATPAVGIGEELMMGQDFTGRPLPWNTAQRSTAKSPRYTWLEYGLTHGPIPMQGPIKYVYDSLRKQGSTAMDANAIIKGLISVGVMTVIGQTGLHAAPDISLEPKPAPKPYVPKYR
jgi:hypothetical protein